jgi:hypothetical protein
MLGLANKSARQKFNDGILTTFGKLDAFDIEKVDGRPDQLVINLMKYYGWSSADAQHKVNQFMRRISSSSL